MSTRLSGFYTMKVYTVKIKLKLFDNIQLFVLYFSKCIKPIGIIL